MKQEVVVEDGARGAELRWALREAVARMDRPVTVKELRKALPRPYQRPEKEIASRLDELAASNDLFVVVAGKTRKYTHREPAALVEQAILGALSGKPLTKAELAARVKKAAPGAEKLVPERLAALAARRALFEHPKVGEAPQRFALEPVDPAPFLDKAVKELRAALAKLGPHGVELPAIYEALGRALGLEAARPSPPPLDDEATVLAAVREVAALEPPGSLLRVRKVREAQRLDKERFDRAALRLVEVGKVVLHHHDYPDSLVPAERAWLVRDERGIEYVGIALREAQ